VPVWEEKSNDERFNFVQSKQIKNIFLTRDFQKYMLSTYDVGPLSATRQRIVEFLKLTEESADYIEYIQFWEMRTRREKTRIIHKNEHFSEGQMMLLQPYIELFTDFLLRNYKDEIETSQELRMITDLSMPEQWFPDTR